MKLSRTRVNRRNYKKRSKKGGALGRVDTKNRALSIALLINEAVKKIDHDRIGECVDYLRENNPERHEDIFRMVGLMESGAMRGDSKVMGIIKEISMMSADDINELLDNEMDSPVSNMMENYYSDTNYLQNGGWNNDEEGQASPLARAAVQSLAVLAFYAYHANRVGSWNPALVIHSLLMGW